MLLETTVRCRDSLTFYRIAVCLQALWLQWCICIRSKGAGAAGATAAQAVGGAEAALLDGQISSQRTATITPPAAAPDVPAAGASTAAAHARLYCLQVLYATSALPLMLLDTGLRLLLATSALPLVQ